jgi:hypothetical protein
MPDLTDRLARLGHQSPADAAANDDTIAADRQRGQAALRRRTVQRSAIGVGGVAAVAAVVALAVTGTSSPAKHEAAIASTRPVATHATTAPKPVTPTHPAGRPAAIRLVSYDGPQRAGFTVASVPSGYVLQGVTGATLDIAEPGDHSSLDSFVGKLTVSVEASSEVGGLGIFHGTPVTVNGEKGIYSIDKTGVSSITYEQGHGSGNLVTVQCWSNIKLTQDQLINFAQGVAVTADVQRSHG